MGLGRAGAGGAVLRAGVLYFLVVFGAGFLLGTLRVLLLVPRLGTRTAELIEMPLMLAVILLAARAIARRHPGFTWRQSFATGAIALALLVAAELSLAWMLSGLDPAAWLASRDPVSGTAYLLSLLVYAAAPGLLRPRGRL